MTTDKMGCLLEFVADNGYDDNTLIEVSHAERQLILSTWPASEVIDRTDCAASWEEHARRYHDDNLFSTL
jgi:hypothetical protein